MFFQDKNPDENNDQARQEHENGYAVDAVHVFHPPGIWGFGVPLDKVKVFCDLSEYAHLVNLCSKIVTDERLNS